MCFDTPQPKCRGVSLSKTPNHMIVIFDSKVARENAPKNPKYYVSSSFQVKPGEKCWLYMTNSFGARRYLRFYIHRTPEPLTKSDNASVLDGIYLRLKNQVPNKHEPKKPSLKYLGSDEEGNFIGFLTFDIPGWYYLFAPLVDSKDRPMNQALYYELHPNKPYGPTIIEQGVSTCLVSP